MHQPQYNYLPIEMADLPSRGFAYRPDAYIRGRFLTVQDVKFLSLLSEATAEHIINEILGRCFDSNLDFADLALCDRTYLVFWLRANSFMKENGYRVTISRCRNCHASYDFTIKLDDLPIKYLQHPPSKVVLPRSGQLVQLKLPTVKDLQIVDDDRDVQKIARMIDVPDAVPFVLSLKAMDFAYLLHVADEFDVGFDMKFEPECPHCHAVNQLECVISESALFGQINMRDVISLSMKITKYLTYQVSDDTPWPEFEMIAELTNAMIKEENEEMQKQEAAAKAKAQAAQSQARTSSYRHR